MLQMLQGRTVHGDGLKHFGFDNANVQVLHLRIEPDEMAQQRLTLATIHIMMVEALQRREVQRLMAALLVAHPVLHVHF